MLYEPHEASRGFLPRHDVYRTTSIVPPHTLEDRAVVEEAFPALKSSRPLYLNVSAGECLYIPAFWWHGLIATASESDHGNTSIRATSLANTTQAATDGVHVPASEHGSILSRSTAAMDHFVAAVSAPVMSVSMNAASDQS